LNADPAATVLEILVVEDDPVVGVCVVDALVLLLGAKVDRTLSGLLGAQKLCQQQFALAIIDSGLPGAWGTNVAKGAANNDTPVLLLSGQPAHLAEFERLNLPYLAKPFSLVQLVAASLEAIADASTNILRVKASLTAMAGSIATLHETPAETLRLHDKLPKGTA
jgi:DNA-binding response OmpR family regulator